MIAALVMLLALGAFTAMGAWAIAFIRSGATSAPGYHACAKIACWSAVGWLGVAWLFGRVAS